MPGIFLPVPRSGARIRLICVPHAGGGASSFAAWARELPADVELRALQLPGREERLGDTPIARWDEALGEAIDSLASSLDRPFALFGHSLGAAIAFELARRLGRRSGLLHLFVSGRRAPHLPRDRAPAHALAREDFVRELRRWHGTPEDVLQDDELLDTLLPLLRADFALSETHECAEDVRVTAPISAYGGEDDEHVPAAALDAWRVHTSSAFRRVTFPGGHFFLHERRAAVITQLVNDLRDMPRAGESRSFTSNAPGRVSRDSMPDERLYLGQNVQVEPLCDQWYAWPHLIPPATAARNLTERHLRIIDSYLQAPGVHASAAKNPQMLGGPFIDHGGKRVEELKALRDRTKRERADLIALSAALGELNALLLSSAKGFSLQGLYPQVPAILRGYVELAYDLNNHPTYRLIEPLLYRSRYYDDRSQSLMLRTISADHRPFVLSTPRLEDDTSAHLRVPFADERLDRLFALKTQPQPWQAIRDLFDVPPASEAMFRSFFTSVRPRPYEAYDGGGIRWRYFGHACVLIETAGLTLLFDPVLSYTYEADISRYTYADLPDTIDYVFITHNHQDHILMETLLQLRHKIRTIVVPRNAYGSLQDPSLKLMFEAIGFTQVIELGECETLPLSGRGEVMTLPFFGEHADLAVGTKLAYFVRLGRHTLMFAADSCNLEPLLYEHVHRMTGDLDVLFLGMECDGAPLSWLYGALMPQRLERAMDQSRRLAGSNFEQAIQIVNQFRCKEVYVYAMGQEPWLNYIMSIKYTEQSRPIVDSTRLIADCLGLGVHAERLFGEKEILIDDVPALAGGAAALPSR